MSVIRRTGGLEDELTNKQIWCDVIRRTGGLEVR